MGALVVLRTAPVVGTAQEEGAGLPPLTHGAVGQALSDVCSVVLQLPPLEQRWARALAARRTTVDGSVAVHQAVGMIAAAHEVDIATAAAALVVHAARRGTSAEALAVALVTRTVAAAELRPERRDG